MKNFFISYNRADERWATWIAWTLEGAGYTTVVQAWDFRPGSNFVREMNQAAAESERIIAVLSPDYLPSRFTLSEWSTAFAKDPAGENKLLVPVRVREFATEGVLFPNVYIDLVGLEEETAAQALLAGVSPERAKPESKPQFPGDVQPEMQENGNSPHTGKRLPYFSLSLEAELRGSDGEIFSLAFSQDAKYVVGGGEERLLLWSLNDKFNLDRKGIKVFDHPAKIVARKQNSRVKGSMNYIYSVAFSHNGKWIACGGQDGIVRIWDVETGDWLRSLAGHKQAVYSITFSPDDALLASGSYDEDVIIWDMASFQSKRSLDRTGCKPGRVTSICFSPYETEVAIGTWQDDIVLWNIETDKMRYLRGHTSSVESVAFSPDGALLASGGMDKRVRVWDILAETPQEKYTKEHQYVVKCVTFSPDSHIVASASWDMTVVLWDAQTGQRLKDLPLRNHDPSEWHQDWIWSIAFSPNGFSLATGGSDQKALLWRLGSA